MVRFQHYDPSIVTKLLQILGSLIDLLLLKDLVEELYLNLNIERGGDTVLLLHLPPLLRLLLCLHVKEVGSQRSKILIRGDTDLLPLVILLKTMVGIKNPDSLLLRLLTFIQQYSLIGLQRNHRTYYLIILCITLQGTQDQTLNKNPGPLMKLSLKSSDYSRDVS